MAVANTSQPIPVSGTTFEPISMQPKICADAILNASVKDKQSLIDIHELLSALFVRNRNQHRRNHWFKSLQQFRKQLGLLLQEIDTEKKTAAVVQKVQARLQFWDERCIHQWYLHFTQLVAVGPFAMLGLVLMACTARTCRVTGITALYEEIGSVDMRMALQMIDDGAVEEELGGLLGGEQEDEGELVARW